jgi:hypothetical protein
MAPRSSIDKLPEDVRRWLERALTENGFSGYVELSEEYAGQVICFPKDYRYKIAQRTWIFITVLTVEIGANLGVVIIGLRML